MEIPASKKRIKLVVSYDGTAFHGFQVQPGKRTVQGELEKALSELFGTETAVVGCSRTDAGVHAVRFVLHADVPASFPTDRLHFALNTMLPPDVSALGCSDADENFHARFSCLGKTYRYVIHNSPVRSPFFENRAWFLPGELDTGKMADAAGEIVGKHDFAAFMAQGSSVSCTVRTVSECRVERGDGGIISLYVTADGFLYNMVRIIAGTIAEAGKNKLCGSVSDIIGSRDRTRAGMTAPPCGLYLWDVKY